jgi:DNA/RNA-binding domain of Phe-tRNA-synthetase-like protein
MNIKNGYDLVKMLVIDDYYVRLTKGKHSRTIEFEDAKISVTDENGVTKEYYSFRNGDESSPSAESDRVLLDMLYCNEKTSLEVW